MIGWLDAGSGASGDMLLGALLDAGADEHAIAGAIHAVAPESISVSSERVRRASLTALRAHVDVADSTTDRGLADILVLIERADLDADVVLHSTEVFRLLGEAEAEVHGVSSDEVHFHEVGALDAIADIVGICAGFVSLALDELHCSAIAVGSGTIATSHGQMTVPPPAVARLLRGIATYAGPADTELCTPTGAALLAHWVTQWGAQPLMSVQRIGTGAGRRDFPGHANVLRLFLGSLSGQRIDLDSTAIVYESNVDDLDPRLWPPILQRLLEAGASDAWLTPILMKKGRPAHTLSVLLRAEHADAVRRVFFAETSAIGLRESRVGKQALDREFTEVSVSGRPVSIKIARLEGEIVNIQPEYEDVLAAADALGRPVKTVLADAITAAAALWERY